MEIAAARPDLRFVLEDREQVIEEAKLVRIIVSVLACVNMYQYSHLEYLIVLERKSARKD